ncbi:acyl-coenzyme A diphosphatase FITM2 [Ambystoma mexicanum]|uniref:acyl-coenzyme A diphosphatase FITM2 n=1 Tax=Ambystoma mexicanum TaxID=8296 RepID=UPI0037E89476
MDALEYIVRFFRDSCLNDSVQRHMCLFLVALTVVGSALKELCPLPDTYMSNKRNVLNVYFVKVAWGWTLWLLLPFIALTNFALTRNVKEVLRRLTSLLVGTAVWYICTQFFLFIENLTGSCYSSKDLEELVIELGSRRECIIGGGFWHGFDISGHSFLLPYCVLIIVEETAVIHDLKLGKNRLFDVLVSILFVFLGIISFIWIWMYLCTAIYFHELDQKLFGTAFGVLAWFGTYKSWYTLPCSPGLPPKSASGPKKSEHYRQ